MKNILKNIGKIALFLGLIFGLGYASLMVLIGIAWSGAFLGYDYIPLTAYGLLVLGIITCILSLMWFRKHIKKIAVTTLVFGAIFILIFPINSAYRAYQESLIIDEGEIDVTQYEPFSNRAEIAKLDEPSTLKFDNDLPRLDGATALYPVYSAFVEAVYPNKHYPSIKGNSEVECTNTINAYENLIHGRTDIIFVAQPSVNQLQKATDSGVDLHLTPIGNEAFVFFVNHKNKVDDLNFELLKGIYSGEIINWKDVGGSNREIIPYQRNEGSGSQTMFLNVMNGVDIQKAPQEQTVGGMGGIINKTARYKNADNAIGFSFLYYATQMNNNDKIKILSINGVAPTKETIASREYPFTGTFYAITNGEPTGNAKLFIDWILSEQGQELIEKTGYAGI